MKTMDILKKMPANVLLLIILILAAGMRLWQLNFQSLWLDEIYTMNMANPDHSWSEIYELSFVDDPLSVLYFILLNSFFKVFGYSAVVARLFSVAMGVLGIFVVYLLGKELKNKRTGLLAALLVGRNFFHIFYSQEARVYAMYMCASALSFLYLYKFLKTPTAGASAKYGLSVLFLVLSHFFGFFALAAQLLIILMFALYQKKIKFFGYVKLSSLAMVIVLIGYLPVIPIFILLTKSKGTWIPAPHNLELFRLFKEFNGGSTMLSLALGSLIVFALVAAMFPESKFLTSTNNQTSAQNEKAGLVFLLTWILVSFLIPFLISKFRLSIFHSRYMISYLPAFMLLVALGLDAVADVRIRTVILLLVSSAALYNLLVVRNYYNTVVKANFREASHFVLDHIKDKDPVLTTLPYHFNYYFRNHADKMSFSYREPKNFIADMHKGLEPKRGFWWVDAHGRQFVIDSTDLGFFNSNFEVKQEYQGFDAWAKYLTLQDSVR